MTIFSPTSTFVRFTVETPLESDLASFLAEVFKKAAFKDPEPLQKQATGFTSIDNMFDSTFPYANYEKGEYVTFNFRVDERKIPKAVFKQFLHRAEAEYRAKHEGKRPHTNEWQDIKDAVELKLLSQILPSPRAFEVVWSPVSKYLLFGSAQEKIIDLFLGYFEEHFKIYPQPVDALTSALQDKQLGQQEKDYLSRLIASRSRELNKDIFLGSEFLIWLWFFSDTREGRVTIPSSDPQEDRGKDINFELYLGNKIILEQTTDGITQKVSCTGPDAAYSEARTALREGKKIKEAEYEITVGENKYSFTLDTRLWAVKGLKTPKVASSLHDDDPDGRFLEKIYLIEEALKYIDLIYHQFLTLRLGITWDRDITPELKKWVEKTS